MFKSSVIITALAHEILTVEAKICRFTDSYGGVRNYECHQFEYCCDRHLCCKSSLSFYRLWYFWLCLMLALMFCSGGGYWYRQHFYRHRQLFASASHFPPSSTLLMSSHHRNSGGGPRRGRMSYALEQPYVTSLPTTYLHSRAVTLSADYYTRSSSPPLTHSTNFRYPGPPHLDTTAHSTLPPPYSESLKEPVPPPSYSSLAGVADTKTQHTDSQAPV